MKQRVRRPRELTGIATSISGRRRQMRTGEGNTLVKRESACAAGFRLAFIHLSLIAAVREELDCAVGVGETGDSAGSQVEV